LFPGRLRCRKAMADEALRGIRRQRPPESGRARRARLPPGVGLGVPSPLLATGLPAFAQEPGTAWTITSTAGVIERACRQVVKDWMERAGLHGMREGAEAMLEARRVFVSGEWQPFLTFRIEQEAQRPYPHCAVAEGQHYTMAV